MIRLARQTGFTLMEVLFALTVLGIAIAAMAQAGSTGQKATYEALRELRAMSLAEAMMEEIISLPYDDPEGTTTLGPDAGEVARTSYDNIDDFHGFTESRGSCRDMSGVRYPASYDDFGRSVSVATSTLTLAGASATSGVSITVLVQDQGGRQWCITRFVAKPT